MEVRKIFKAGNSCVVSLPANMLKTLGLKDGSHLTIEVNREQRAIILKPVIVKNSGMSIEFVRLVDKLMVEYEYALRRLAE
ncbi:MAG: AbrB/MazE/SpoVT family DNA-binding domain-containing protein [Veillonellaceae bacterium]|jgi:putative addiction module antidote|nr:AbrB/MazE/SpoVT family DNA-binding domain-containing protein [Veillonellaceae bacterium]